MGDIEITDGQRANWAVAAAGQRVTKRLRPELRKAYSLAPYGEVNADALPDAIAASREITACLEAALTIVNGEQS